MSWDENFFDNVEFEEIEMDVNGTMVSGKVPIVMRDMSRIVTVSLIDAEKAQALLPPGIEVASKLLSGPLPEGKAALFIGITEKRQVDGLQMLPYTEVFICIIVAYQGEPMYHAIQVPNTTTETVDGVKALWNFPSFLCEVTNDETEDAITSRVEADGQHLLTMKVPKGETRLMTMPTAFTTVIDGEIRVARGLQQVEMSIADGSEATLELGDHPYADTLRDLDVGQCVMSAYSPKIQYWLDAAK